jgi:hypothetical protein
LLFLKIALLLGLHVGQSTALGFAFGLETLLLPLPVLEFFEHRGLFGEIGRRRSRRGGRGLGRRPAWKLGSFGGTIVDEIGRFLGAVGE